MCVAQVVGAYGERNPRSLKCRLPDLQPEPVAGDVAVSVDHPWLTRGVLARGAALRPVDRGGVLAIGTPALASVVPAHRRVPILAPGRVGFGEAKRRKVRYRAQTSSGGVLGGHREDQIVGAQVSVLDVGHE